MPEEFMVIAIIGIIFVAFPGLIFHYVTLWRQQKTLNPDDERMLEDLWRSARAMERRIESLESVTEIEESAARDDARRTSANPNYRRDA